MDAVMTDIFGDETETMGQTLEKCPYNPDCIFWDPEDLCRAERPCIG